MTQQEKISLYTNILESWDVEAQVNMVMEETGEMLSALGKASRGRVTREEVITELADVSIMVEQMAVYFGLGKFEEEKERKLQRLAGRFEKWRKNNE